MKNRIKKAVINGASLSREEVERLVNQVAVLVNDKRAIEAAVDAKVLLLKAACAKQTGAIDETISELLPAIQQWAEAHPDLFTKKKSLELQSATIGFRTDPPKVALLSRKWNWEKVTEAVQQLLPNFIRSKPEVDKEAILAQRAELAEFLPKVGVKVVQGEQFFIDPKITETETRQVMMKGAA